MTEAGNLLLEIASCDVARRHLADPAFTSACSAIVATQGAPDWERFQVPEPWSGDIASAPILFLGSNPSISATEAYPNGAAEPADVTDFFTNRFGGHWIRNGIYPREKNGGYGAGVRYWIGIRNRTSELLQRDAIAGRDYALAEIVHCKSKSEVGVEAAIQHCAERFLMKILEDSAAKLIVLVGKKAWEHFNSLHVAGLPQIPKRNGAGPVCVAGRDRIFIYLGHPTGPERKHFEDWLSEAKLEQIRSLLRQC